MSVENKKQKENISPQVLTGKIDNNKKIEIITKLFKKDNVPLGKIFLPDDTFYSQWDNTGNGLRLMASKISGWLNITIRESVSVGFSEEMESPGLFINEKGRRTIFVNAKHKDNPFECAAILSHEMMHYYLMAMNEFSLDDTLENEQLTDLATIYSGLGILIINGFQYYSGWHETIIGLMLGMIRFHTEKLSFGYFKPKDYGQLLKNYLSEFKIDGGEARSYILPKARAFLPFSVRLKKQKAKPNFVLLSEKMAFRETLLKIGIIIIFIPIAMLVGYIRNWGTGSTGSNNNFTSSEKAQVEELQSYIDKSKKYFDGCVENLKSKENDLNTVEIEMNSLKSMGKTYEYNNLVQKQNDIATSYEFKAKECEKINRELNSKIDEYNGMIQKK
jgi:hypothetical protein